MKSVYFGNLSDKELIDTLRYNSHIIISQHVVKWAVDFFQRNQCLTQAHRDNVIKVLYGSGSILPPSLSKNAGGYVAPSPTVVVAPVRAVVPTPTPVVPSTAVVNTAISTRATNTLIKRIHRNLLHRLPDCTLTLPQLRLELAKSPKGTKLVDAYLTTRGTKRGKTGSMVTVRPVVDSLGYVPGNLQFLTISQFNKTSVGTQNIVHALASQGKVQKATVAQPVAQPVTQQSVVKTSSTETPWLTPEEAAGYFKVKVKTIYDLRKKGLGRKIGSSVRFHRDELNTHFLSK